MLETATQVLTHLIETEKKKAELKIWQDLWKFWIDPLNDDMEVEQHIKDRLKELQGEVE